MVEVYLGIDVGSVSTDFALIDEFANLIGKRYLRTAGAPIEVIKKGLTYFHKQHNDINIKGAGTTGSGRRLAGVMIGADVIKNEITAHAVAAAGAVKGVRTVLEIGGQDSKIIILNNGVALDFAMNSVCAAGTGSFLDQQAARLGVPIEEFGQLALKSSSPVRIAGRCSVFAESDMIHKQQLGHSVPDIVAGLCQALVRNYLNNVAGSKEIKEPVIFQGGVAANEGIKRAFEEELNLEIIIPEQYEVMGAIGAALLARDEVRKKQGKTTFKGLKVTEFDYRADSFICEGCANNCEVINIFQEGELIARWGGKCRKHQLQINK